MYDRSKSSRPIDHHLPFAEFAEVDDDLFGDVSGDVNLGPETSHAHVGRVRRYGHPTLAT